AALGWCGRRPFINGRSNGIGKPIYSQLNPALGQGQSRPATARRTSSGMHSQLRSDGAGNGGSQCSGRIRGHGNPERLRHTTAIV
ncbi:MAG TPA: hypothetical protein VGB07_18235, partial [Blastocatellia bacterium]